jgi:Flp pilus assembly protein TadB
VVDNPATTSPRSTALRFPLGRSGLFAAAALAGAIVYWRAGERQRSRQRADEIDLAVAQGREAADAALRGSEAHSQPFDQR